MKQKISTRATLDPEQGTAIFTVNWGHQLFPPKAFTLVQLRRLLDGGPEGSGSVSESIARIWPLPQREARLLSGHLRGFLDDLEEGRSGEFRAESESS